MPREASVRGTDMAIKNLRPRPGQSRPVNYSVQSDYPGLKIQVSPRGSKSWLLRLTTGMKPHPTSTGEMIQVRRVFGLGPYPKVSLQDARELARIYHLKIADGVDPKAEKRKRRSDALAAQSKLLTFGEVEKLTPAKSRSQNQAKAAKDRRARLDTYILPKIGNRLIADITSDDVAEILRPLWHDSYHLARKLRDEMSAVFAYAKVRNLRTGDNPAAKKGNLDILLGPTDYKTKHHPALPYARMAEFIADLRIHPGDSARALEFAVLTASRVNEVTGAKWSEIHIENRLWTIPAERMKGRREHRVPLSDMAIKILNIQKETGGEFVFPGRKGQPLSNNAMGIMIDRMHETNVAAGGPGYLDPLLNRIAVPHGFRSSFKDWARNLTQYADEVSELALAHVNSDSTRAAYARDELLSLRTPMMQKWTDHCGR